MTGLDLLTRLAPILFYDSAERYRAVSINGTPDTLYGRMAIEGADVWAQFWLWYECNWSLLKGKHDGDWECVQYRVNPDGLIAEAAYAQHAHGQTRSWLDVDRTGGRPHVYVANGTHASYFKPGWHRRTKVSLERANGKGRAVPHPVVELMPSAGWPQRPGKWGDDEHSPASPARHVQWRHPSTWAGRL